MKDQEEPAAGAVPGAAADEQEGHAGDDGAGPRSALAGVASTIADAANPVISAARRPVHQFASGARRMLDERTGARVRAVRRLGREPLANLWELHPEARRASIRELGLVTVPIEQVKGTAVEGSPQRGGDFLPLRERRGEDWRGRWQRIMLANERLISLPPVELIKFGDSYWVVDGHNRVAAALYSGQVALDAVVDELRLPGQASEHAHAVIAPFLEDSQDVRAAGRGRLSRTTSRPTAAPDRREPDGGRQRESSRHPAE